MPVYVHVIDHPEGRVLVDTGMMGLPPLLADIDPPAPTLSDHGTADPHRPGSRLARRAEPGVSLSDARPAGTWSGQRSTRTYRLITARDSSGLVSTRAQPQFVENPDRIDGCVRVWPGPARRTPVGEGPTADDGVDRAGRAHLDRETTAGQPFARQQANRIGTTWIADTTDLCHDDQCRQHVVEPDRPVDLQRVRTPVRTESGGRRAAATAGGGRAGTRRRGRRQRSRRCSGL